MLNFFEDLDTARRRKITAEDIVEVEVKEAKVVAEASVAVVWVEKARGAAMVAEAAAVVV